MRVVLVSRQCKKLTAVTSGSGLQTQMPEGSMTLKWLTSGSQVPWKKGAAGQSSNCWQETDRPTSTKSSFLPQRNRKSRFIFFLTQNGPVFKCGQFSVYFVQTKKCLAFKHKCGLNPPSFLLFPPHNQLKSSLKSPPQR